LNDQKVKFQKMLRLEKTKENQFDILSLHGEVDASNSVILDKAIQELSAKVDALQAELNQLKGN
jgi:hypothetical protein